MGNQWDQTENQKASGNKWEWTHNPKPMGHREVSPEEEIHRTAGLPNKDKKSQINNLTLHLKHLEEQQQSPDWEGRK